MRIVSLAAAILLGTGCSDSVGPERLLVGRWGSGTAELVALRSGAELHLQPACIIVVFDAPLELTEGNEFGAHGAVWTSTATAGDRPRATVSGSLEGDLIHLRVALPAEWFPLSLEAGVAPEPEEIPTCPLPALVAEDSR